MTGPMCRTIGGRGDVIGMAFGAVGEASSSVLVHAKACAEAISKEAMSDGDVDAVTKDTGYGRVLGEIIRDWGVACAKRRAECLIKLVSKTVPNISTASGGGRLATDYNKEQRRSRLRRPKVDPLRPSTSRDHSQRRVPEDSAGIWIPSSRDTDMRTKHETIKSAPRGAQLRGCISFNSNISHPPRPAPGGPPRTPSPRPPRAPRARRRARAPGRPV